MARASEKRKSRLASARRRLDEHKHGSRPSLNLPGGVPFFNPKDEAYTITIMPFKVGKSITRYKKDLVHADPGDLYYEQSFFTHRDVGPDQVSVVCPQATFGKRCPVCEERGRLGQDPKYKGTEDGKKALKALAPKERQLFAVLDHEDRKKGIQLWEISPFNFGYNLDDKIKKARDEIRDKLMDFHDPDGGYDVRITGREKTMGPGTKPFNEFFVDEFIERARPLDPKLLEKVPCLCDVPVLMEYKELSDLFFGPKEDDKPSRNGSAEVDDDEEIEDDDDTDDEEPAGEIAVGDTVKGEYKGKVRTGVVKKLKGTLATVVVKGLEKPWTVETDELTLVDEEDEEEPEEEEDDGPEDDLDEDEETDDDDGDTDDDDSEDEEPLEDDDSDDSEDDEDTDEDESPRRAGKKQPEKRRRRR